MNFLKKSFLALLLLFSADFFLQAQPVSTALSLEAFDFLQNNNFVPQKQALIASDPLKFPFNIYISFSSDTASGTRNAASDNLLLLCFNQEDLLNNQKEFVQLLSSISSLAVNTQLDFPVTVLFSYGEKQHPDKKYMVYGIQEYLELLPPDISAAALYFSTDENLTNIYTNSDGVLAPSWLIKNAFTACSDNKIPASIPLFYISQLFKFKATKDKTLSFFNNSGIPAIKICYGKNLSRTNVFNSILDNIYLFYEIHNRNSGQHFIILNLFKKHFCITETAIVRTVICILFIFLFFIFLLCFINSDLRLSAWSKIKKTWYILPETFLLCFAAFTAGKYLTILISKNFSDTARIYLLIFLQYSLSFLLVIFSDIFIYLPRSLHEARTIDFLIIIGTTLNQFIFFFVDISLFPLFMFFSILSIISFSTKNNVTHIILFLLMLVPFLVYGHQLIETIQSVQLWEIMSAGFGEIIFCSLTLYPVLLLFLRLLTSVKENFKTNKGFYIFTSVFALIIILGGSFTAILRTYSIKKLQKTSAEITQGNDVEITFSNKDRKVFEDTIRTIDIGFTMPENMELLQVSVELKGVDEGPVLFSDNEYFTEGRSDFFKICSNPPSQMSFTYGTKDNPHTVKIIAMYENTVLKKDFYTTLNMDF